VRLYWSDFSANFIVYVIFLLLVYILHIGYLLVVFIAVGRPFLKWLTYAIAPLSVCLSYLSVTLVYCGQTVSWIKMKLGIEVGLGPSQIVLDGYPAPPKSGTASNIWPIAVVAKWLDESRCHLVPR